MHQRGGNPRGLWPSGALVNARLRDRLRGFFRHRAAFRLFGFRVGCFFFLGREQVAGPARRRFRGFCTGSD
mgnify:CR=1 FL=1